MSEKIKNKKGQNESIGLAVIVLFLILISMFFLLQKNESVDYKKQTSEILNDNFLYSFLNSKIKLDKNCREKRISELIDYYYTGKVRQKCKGKYITNNKEEYKNLLVKKLEKMLSFSLEKWNKTYSLKIYLDKDYLINKNYCEGKERYSIKKESFTHYNVIFFTC